MKLSLAGTALALALTTGSAEANMVAGLGNSSCGTWTTARHDQRAWGYEQWVLGYVSGASEWKSEGGDPLDGLDIQAVLVWMDNFCQSRPLATIEQAGMVFVTGQSYRAH